MGSPETSSERRIDDAMEAWRQGDCVLEPQWFLFRNDLDLPLTPEGALAAENESDAAEAEVDGFMVLTQTCDLVRACRDRPYVEVCPLVRVTSDVCNEIARGRRPRYAWVPRLADRCLVADLDRVMTVEKGVVAGWCREAGWETDPEARRLALALARKRARFAFPDDFTYQVRGLVTWLTNKHDKDSDEGRALRSLREIRVQAAPSWNAEMVELMFWFIRDDAAATFENQHWDPYLDAWLKRVPATMRFTRVDGAVLTLNDMTAREYADSDPLDLDHLSSRDG